MSTFSTKIKNYLSITSTATITQLSVDGVSFNFSKSNEHKFQLENETSCAHLVLLGGLIALTAIDGQPYPSGLTIVSTYSAGLVTYTIECPNFTLEKL
jgi:hypothetical protein